MTHLLSANRSKGFTLIELSIVLVIIGLIVGGVLVGQDLIRAAGVRSVIAQLDKYNQAVNAFLGKYDALPGDIPEPNATKFGFVARGVLAGEGNGNGLIEGTNGSGDIGLYQGIGEVGLFWVDLSTARLIDGGFNTALATGVLGSYTGADIGKFLPAAKIERLNYFYVWTGGPIGPGIAPDSGSGFNYFSLARIRSLGQPSSGGIYASPGLTVREAFSIDSKIDDGKPHLGRVTPTAETGGQVVWATGDTMSVGASNQAATPGSALTCHDNNNVALAVHDYSITQNNGNGVNCWLSFRFQ